MVHNTETFIEKATAIHHGRYDYSKTVYVNNHTKLCIICPIHGEFWQKPSNHLMGRGCPECKTAKIQETKRKRNIKSPEDFERNVRERYGNRYDLSLMKYEKSFKKVTIVCHCQDVNGNEHGAFEVLPTTLLSGWTCPKCNRTYKPKNIGEFAYNFYMVHPEKKDVYTFYEDEPYKNSKTKIRVCCHCKDEEGNEHGDFLARPNDLLTGYGCPICANNIQLTTEEFIKRATKVHGNRYDYSKVVYHDMFTKVCIICPDHGPFYQTPGNHIHRKTKCPYCNSNNKSSKEEEIACRLDELGLKYEREKQFPWLRYQRNLRLDFYLPDYNVAIEFQGEQHFQSIEKFGGMSDFRVRQVRDIYKRNLCDEHKVKLFCLRGRVDLTPVLDYIKTKRETADS